MSEQQTKPAVQPNHPNLRRGGGRKGHPNKTTMQARQVVARIADNNAEAAERWLHRVAKVSPAKALDLYLRLLEFHMPKLARTELTGEDGKAITVRVVRFGHTLDGEVVETAAAVAKRD